MHSKSTWALTPVSIVAGIIYVRVHLYRQKTTRLLLVNLNSVLL
jgi:hypothetical protein